MMAMHFLRYEKRCPVAVCERCPRRGIGEPDVLGVTKDRYLLEIEIKRTVSDFKANGKKSHLLSRYRPDEFRLQAEQMMPKWPKQFWFLVPPEIVDKVSPLVPDFAGLMRGPDKNESWQVRVVKPAPTNHASLRLTVREMLELGHNMANQILSQMHTIQTYKQRFVDGHSRCASGLFDSQWSPEI